MKILTWNIQRPKKANQLLLDKLAEYNADIIILTETNNLINLGSDYSPIQTAILAIGYDGYEKPHITAVSQEFLSLTENKKFRSSQLLRNGGTFIHLKVKTLVKHSPI